MLYTLPLAIVLTGIKHPHLLTQIAIIHLIPTIYYLCFVRYDEGLIYHVRFFFLFHFPLLFYLDCFFLVVVQKKSSLLVTGIFRHLLEAFIVVSSSSFLLLLFSTGTLSFWFSTGSFPSPTQFFASPKS